MSTQTQVIVPGPLHPDLFDGETPILAPLAKPPKLYQVEVMFTRVERDRALVTVAASTEQEAQRLAVEAAEEVADPDEMEHEPGAATEVDAEPDAEQLQAWMKRRQEA